MFFFFFFFTEKKTVFANRLAETMETKGLNPISMAMIIGVSPQTVKHWVNGKFKPRFDRENSIADTLEVSTDYLHGRT